VPTPRSLEEISAEWLTRGLRRAGVTQAARVTGFRATRIGEGLGFLSSVFRLLLDYDRSEADAPRSVVAKLEPADTSMRDFEGELHAFQREIRFYEEIAPGAPIRLARLYFAESEPPDYAMVMEDLSFARPGDQVAGLHASQVKRGAYTIGCLQGRYWGDEALRSFDWMPASNGVQGDFDAKWDSFVEHFGYTVDPAGLELGARLLGRADWLEAEIGRRPRTIVHSDLRADNLMLGDEGTPEEILILDWQIAVRGLGAFDVARLMGGSELPSERRGHQLEVLHAWWEALGAEGVRDYPFEDATRDLRLGALATLWYPVHFHTGVLESAGRSRALLERMFRRLFDSAVELDAGAVLPG